MRPILTVLMCLTALSLGCSERDPDPAPLALVSTPPGAEAEHSEVPLGQLPRHVQPRHYRLQLTILPESSHFTGTAEIDLNLAQPVDHFYLHGRFLEPSEVSLSLAGEALAVAYEQVDPSGVVRITLPRAMAGDATLRIAYSAPFNRSLEALYQVEAGGRAYAFTQFQAISAREAFPGFDEPAFKTPYDVSLLVHAEHVAIANTPQAGETLLEDGLKRVDFATSQPLPTYLVAFAVGPFDVVEAEALPPTRLRDRPIPLRGIAVAGRGAELQFALDNTRGILESLENYFATPYPYQKLDLIAVPDFGAGAMENAGAITYRDSLLLIDPGSRPQIKRNFQMVHAHELAHQWFGNLVTPEWWDDIWLNESFATWVSYVTLDLWQPEAHWRRDLSEDAVAVMERDSLTSARQIRQPVLSHHDIANAFDGITYSKGGAVLSMFETFLGRDAFRAGVQEHMRRHAWGTATADDFIDALASQASLHRPEQITAAFRSFLEQAGLPMLEAVLDCQPGQARVNLRQSRYLPLGSGGDTVQQWLLPVCLQLWQGDGASTHCLLLDQPDATIDLGPASCPDVLMPNAGGAGYYRWSLDPAGWQRLLAATDRLNVDEMMSVTASLDGAFNAGAIDVATYLQVARRLAASDDYQVATAPMDELEFIYQRLADASQREALAAEFETLYAAALDEAGMTQPADIDAAQMQSLVTEFMATYARLPELREELKSMAWRHVGYPGQPGVNPVGVNDNLAGLALAVAVRDDDPDASFARHLEQVLLASDNAVFRSRALDALGYATQADYRAHLLELALSEQLRANEFYLPIYRQMVEEATRVEAWDWFRDNLDRVLQRVPEWGKGSAIRYAGQFCDTDHRAEVEAFFGSRAAALQGGPRMLASTLEAIDLCIAKAKHHRPELDALLAE